MTNRKWLESLSDDQLAEWLSKLYSHQINPELFCKVFCRYVDAEGQCTKINQFGDIVCDHNLEDTLFLWLRVSAGQKGPF